MADEPTTEPTAGATTPQQPGQTPPATEAPKGDDGKGGKAAVLADLAAERDKRQALEKTVADLQKQHDDQWSSLMTGLGVKPESTEANPVETLTQQVQQIQTQLAASERKAAILQVAAAPGTTDDGQALPPIPAEYLHLLENAPTEALAETAKSVAQLVARTAASSGSGYASSAGQGQHRSDSTSLPAQIAAAEKELQGADAGTVEQRQAQRRLMSLKSQQLFQATQP